MHVRGFGVEHPTPGRLAYLGYILIKKIKLATFKRATINLNIGLFAKLFFLFNLQLCFWVDIFAPDQL